ncbi:MAG: hypothetical protein QM627_05815 [Luteolibacter sp.]
MSHLFPSLLTFLALTSAVPLLHGADDNTTAPPSSSVISWGTSDWHLRIDPATGALVDIENKNDLHRMDWLRTAGRWERRNWKSDASDSARTLDGQWGLVSTDFTGLLHVAKVSRLSEKSWEAVYTSAALTVTVRREINAMNELVETYTFANTGVVALDFPVGSVSIAAPFFDQYPDSRESLDRRCHAHIWTGGSSSWVNAMRMGTEAPHLGLVVTQGSLEAYSQHGGHFNDRGVFLLHPGAMTIARGESASFSWKLFWHEGWDDFFKKLAKEPEFVRLTAKNYVVTTGQPLEITAESTTSLDSAKVSANGKPIEAKIVNGRLEAIIPTTTPGDLLVSVEQNGRSSLLRAFVTPTSFDLIESRLKFIIRKQQRNTPGHPLDGAYLAYDNETGEQVYTPAHSDHNAGRERVGMGVLGALYLPHCRDADFKAELTESLSRYSDFLSRELEGDDGVVYEELGYKRSGRIYNFIWVAHFRLAMYRATGDRQQLDRFVRVMRAYYATKKGFHFYPIGIPAYDGLKALADAGLTDEHEELLANLKKHADQFVENGRNYPRSEVNYEQSIVAPAVQLMSEMYVITGDPRYLEGARQQMPLLENFAGKQPDARLNEISIRHWDDYWFGKIRAYGDTIPHYWSTINALAYAYYGIGTKDSTWLQRADAVVKGNLPLFTPEGTGSAAYLNALTTNGKQGQRNDPWANDQDWALVNLLMIRALSTP